MGMMGRERYEEGQTSYNLKSVTLSVRHGGSRVLAHVCMATGEIRSSVTIDYATAGTSSRTVCEMYGAILSAQI